MKKLIPISAVLLLGLWIGCGDDKGTDGQPPEEVVRVIADTTVSQPDLDTADEQVWATVDSFRVEVSHTEMYVQAIKKDSNLYLRLRWTDTSFDAWPQHFSVSEIDSTLLPLPLVTFEQQLSNETYEDQVYVRFYSLPDGGCDVWNWRVLSTGGGGLGKGCTYQSSMIKPAPDSAGTGSDSVVAIQNPPRGGGPHYAHKDTSHFKHYVLYTTDTVNYEYVLRKEYDPAEQDSIPVYFNNTTGWSIGQKIPGWLIDSSFASLPDSARGSRWDIRAVSVYDSTAVESPEYRVVLCRELNTGFKDDINLLTVDSVKVNVIIYDGAEDIVAGGAGRSFSDDFWIILNMPD